MAHGIKVWNVNSKNVFPSPLNIFAWASTAVNNNCTISADTSITDSPAGGVPLKMLVTGSDPHIGTYNTKEWELDTANSGETWTLSCWVKASQNTTAELFIFGARSNGLIVTSPNDYSASTVSVGTTWTRVSFTFTFNSSLTKSIQIRLDGPDNGNQSATPQGSNISLWFDGLQLEQASSLSSFTPTPANVVLVNSMLGGRIGYTIATAEYGVSQVYIFNDIPGHQYVKYFVLQAGAHLINLTTENGKAKLTLTHYLINGSFTSISKNTSIAIFATRITNPSYGIEIKNDNEESLASTNYVIPVYRGRVQFPSAYQNFTSDRSIRRHTAISSLGDPNSYKLIFYTIPESQNVWFNGDSIIGPTSGSYEINTDYAIESGSFGTYQLAEAFVFQLNNLTTNLSNATYGIRLYTSETPQKLTLDSGSKHLNIQGDLWNINYSSDSQNTYTSYNVGATQTLDSSNNVVLSGGQTARFGPYTALVIPKYSQYFVSRTQVGENKSLISVTNGYFRRVGSTLYTKAIVSRVGGEDTWIGDISYPVFGVAGGNKTFIIDTKLIDGTGSGGTGTGDFNVSINEGTTGTKTCTYDARLATNCTSSRDYTAYTSGTVGTITYRWHFGINPSNQTYIDTLNGIVFVDDLKTSSTVTITRTASTGVIANVKLYCSVTNNGTTVTSDIDVQFTFTTQLATTTIVPYSVPDYTTPNYAFNENQTIYFKISTTNVPTGTYYYLMNRLSGGTTNPQPGPGDFSEGNAAMSGFIEITNYPTGGLGYGTLTLVPDSLDEGIEQFTMQLKSNDTPSAVNIGDASNVITINDSSTFGSDYALYFSPEDSTNITGGTTKNLIFEWTGADLTRRQTLPTYSIVSDNSVLTFNPASGELDDEADFEPGLGYLGPYKKSIQTTAANITGNNISVTITARSPAGEDIRKTKVVTVENALAPTVTLTAVNTNVEINKTTIITITFSKVVSGFTSNEITSTAGTLSEFTGSGTTYTCKFTAPSTVQTININVAAGVAKDGSNNDNTAATPLVITIVQPILYAQPLISNLVVDPIYSIDFNETTRNVITWTFDITDNAFSYNQRTIVNTGEFIGAKCYWGIEGQSGVTGDDFVGLIYGTITSIDGTTSDTITITIKSDSITEGTTQFRLNFYREGPYVGTPYFTSQYYSIEDTSTTTETLSLIPTTWGQGSSSTVRVTGTPNSTFNYSIDIQGAVATYDTGPITLDATGTFIYNDFGQDIIPGNYTLNLRFNVGAINPTRSENFIVTAAAFDIASVTAIRINDDGSVPSDAIENTIVAGSRYRIRVATNGKTRTLDTNINIIINIVYYSTTSSSWITGDYTLGLIIPANQTTGDFFGILGPEQGNRSGTLTVTGGPDAPTLTTRSATINFTSSSPQITGVNVSTSSTTVVPTTSAQAGVIVNNVAWFTFAVNTGTGTYTIDTNNSVLLNESLLTPDTEIAIYDVRGNRLAFNDDISNQDSLNRRSSITTNLTQGQSYWVGVAHYTWSPATTLWTQGGAVPTQTLDSMQQIRLSIAAGSSYSQPYIAPAGPSIVISRTGIGNISTEITITFNISAITSTFTYSDITFEGFGTLTNFSGSGNIYTAIYTPPNTAGADSIIVNAGRFTDTLGNSNQVSNLLILPYGAQLTPVMTITRSSTASISIPTTINFESSLPVTGESLTISELITSGNGSVSGLFLANSTTWTATYTPPSNSVGQYTITVPAYSFTSSEGNYNTDASSISIEYDTRPARPTMDITTNSTGTVTGSVNIKFQSSEPTSNFTLQDVILTGGGTLTNFGYLGYTGLFSATYTPPVSPLSGIARINVPENSYTGNNTGFSNLAAIELALTYNTGDISQPTVVISRSNNNTITASTVIFITTSEPGYSFNFNLISLVGLGSLNYPSGVDGTTTYSVLYSPPVNATGTSSISIPFGTFTDEAGNPNLPSNLLSLSYDTTDTISPTMQITRSDNSNTTITAPITITFTSSEYTQNFTLEDITLTGLGTLTNFSGSDTVYTAVYTPPENNFNSVSISVAAGKFTDRTRNPNIASNILSINYNTDNTGPTMTIQRGGTAPINNRQDIQFLSSENTNNFTASDITLTGSGTLTDFYQSQFNSRLYIISYYAPSNSMGTATLSVAAGTFTDLAGNLNSASNTLLLEYDSISPTVTLTRSNTDAVVTSPMTITFTISEDTQSFNALEDLEGTGLGTYTNFAGSGSLYTITYTPPILGSGTATVSIPAGAFTDLAFNPNLASNVLTFNYAGDTVRPTMTISRNTTGIVNSAIIITFTSSENTYNFTLGDVILTGEGTLNNFNGSEATYTAIYTPPANNYGTASISVPAEVFTDISQNLNLASNTLSFTYNTDTVRPTMSISRSGSGTITQPVTIVFNSSEATTDFTLADITLIGGGTLSNFTNIAGLNLYYSVTYTPPASAEGTDTISVAENKFLDASGLSNTASNTLSLPYDTIKPQIYQARSGTGIITGAVVISWGTTEATDNFTLADVSGTGASYLSNFVSNSSTSYVAYYTPPTSSSGTHTLYVNAGVFTDAAGNTNLASDTLSLIYDTRETIPPTMTIQRGGVNPIRVPIDIQFLSSENTNNFTFSDITFTGSGTLTNFYQSQFNSLLYIVTYTPPSTGTGTVTFNVAAGAFTDLSGNNNLASNTLSVIYDNISPTITISRNGSETITAGIFITFTTNEDTQSFNIAEDVGGTGAVYLSNYIYSTGTTYYATYTPPSNSSGTHTLYVNAGAFTDLAGNPSLVSNTLSLTYDTIRPTMTISRNTTGIVNSAIIITFTSSENTYNFTLGDVILTGEGTLNNFNGSEATYTATYTPPANNYGTASISVPAEVFTDISQNLNLASNTLSFTYNTDTVRPTMSISRSGSGYVLFGTTNTIYFTSSENTTDFTLADVTITGAGTLSNFSGSGNNYTATYTPAPGSAGTDTISVSANKFTDPTGNFNTASNALSIPYDTVKPQIYLGRSGTGTITGQISIEFATTEATSNFALADVSGTGASYLSNFVSNSSTSYTASYTPPANSSGTHTLYVNAGVFTDAAGNTNLASDTLSLIYDTIPPTMTIQRGGVNPIRVPIDIQFLSSENTNNFTFSDITFTGSGTLTNFYQSQFNSLLYIVTYTPPSTGTGTVTFNVAAGAFTDLSGNNNLASNTLSVIYDNISPTITISRNGSETITAGILITFTTSENTQSFNIAADVGGTGAVYLSNYIYSTGTTYYATYTPPSNSSGTHTLSVSAGAFTDLAGNPSLVSNTLSLTYDTIRPTITVFRNGSETIAGTITIGFSGTKVTNNFITSDVTLSGGGTLGSLYTTNNINYYITYTPPVNSSGSASISVAEGVFTDTSGNLTNTASNTLVIPYNTIDNTPPSMTIARSGSGYVLFGTTNTIYFTSSENTTDFTLADVTITGAGTLSNFSGSGNNYTATYTPAPGSAGTDTISVSANKFTDPAGNFNTASNALSIPYDTVKPQIYLGRSGTGTITGQISIGFATTEATSNFALADVSGTGASYLSNFVSHSSTSYTASYTPPANSSGTHTLYVNAGVFTDAAGNTNLASDTFSLSYNTITGPTYPYGSKTITFNNIPTGGAGGTSNNTGTSGSTTFVTFLGISIVAYGGAGGSYNNGVIGAGGGASVTSGVTSYTYTGGNGGGASGDTGGGGGGGANLSNAAAAISSGGNGAAAATSSILADLVSTFNSLFGISTAGLGYGSTANGSSNNNNGNNASGWGAGGGGANWYGGNGGNGAYGGGGGGAAGFTIPTTGGKGGDGAVTVKLTQAAGTSYLYYFGPTDSGSTFVTPADTTTISIYVIGSGGGGAGAAGSDSTSGGGGGAGGLAAAIWT